MKSVIIIGGGLGGLFCGAILAKEGLEVTVVEKNATVGGGLQSFRRFGETFDTGMHVIGGMQPGGNVRRICEWLGIIDRIDIRHVDDDCTDSIYFAEDRQTYRLAKGRKGFTDSLAQYFPDERAGIEQYVEAIFRLSEELDLFHLRPSDTYIPIHSEEFTMAADAFIAQYVTDARLRSLLAYMNPLYGGRAQQTPAYVHAIISVLYINGASRFVDGSCRCAEVLADFIREQGGTIITNDGVNHINVADRHVTGVTTKGGLSLSADSYISAIHPCTMLTLMDEGALPKSYRNRLNTIPNSYSAFSLYIKLKENAFPYINHSEYYMTRYDEVWNFGQTDKSWPLGFLMMTPPDSLRPQYANKVLITAPMSFEEVRRWEDTTVGRRGEEYLQWKAERAALLLEKVEELHPGFCALIENTNTASPLTIRDYYGAKEGGLSGFSKDYANLTLSQLPVVTKIDNLLLTGQNNNMHGFCGVPLTAIQTCEALLGRNSIIDKINQQ